ncbi:hypothetical protein CASFOL_007896 [Castilleja foliolosa]|uniref:ATP synthase CF1 epsilon subunit n=1 Tax=Castilleja foliolosa TaxID=1961234 RepID=A0ABD3E3Y3_9LAMI
MRINPTTSGSGVSTLEKKNLGRIIQIIGPVLDVAFPPGKMPNIYNALVVKGRDTVGQPINVTCEDTVLYYSCSEPTNHSDWGSEFLRITVLVNDAEKGSDIDPQEAQQTLEIAEANLRKAEGKRQIIEANLALRRARTRVEAVNAIS